MVSSSRPTIGFISLYLVENRALRSLAAFLRERGVRVVEVYFKDWANNRLDNPSETEIGLLLDLLRREGVDLVGLSVRASGYHHVATLLSRRIREELGLPLLWGGLHATSVPEDCIDHADYVCVGEGEETTLELLEALARGERPEGLPGLWVRQGDEVTKGPPRPLLQDIDALPLPDYHSPDKHFISGGKVERGDPYLGSPLLQLSATMGCPFATCTFCGNTILRRLLAPNGRYYRQHSPERVIREIEYAREHFPRMKAIRFEDGVFGFDRAWVREFAALYGARVGLPFSCMADPRVVDDEWVTLMQGAGMTEVFMGIQNTERVNRSLYKRNISNERILRTAQRLHAAQVRASFHIVLDDPVSTTDDKLELFELLLGIPRPYNLFLFSMTVFPKSPLAEQLLAEGLIREDDVEGRATKIFSQWRIALNFQRAPEDTFWAALFVLAPKRAVPRRVLRRLSRSRQLRKDPRPLVAAAQAINTVKMPFMALDMLRRGEVDSRVIRRWLSHPGNWVTA